MRNDSSPTLRKYTDFKTGITKIKSKAAQKKTISKSANMVAADCEKLLLAIDDVIPPLEQMLVSRVSDK